MKRIIDDILVSMWHRRSALVLIGTLGFSVCFVDESSRIRQVYDILAAPRQAP